MANQKKLTRSDVYKQIDAFRGIAKQAADGKPSVESWAESKRVAKEPGEGKFQKLATGGKI